MKLLIKFFLAISLILPFTNSLSAMDNLDNLDNLDTYLDESAKETPKNSFDPSIINFGAIPLCESADFLEMVPDKRPITIAILAWHQENCLPLFLKCIENQTWPKDKTYLHVSVINAPGTEDLVEILKKWHKKIKEEDQYPKIKFVSVTPKDWTTEEFRPNRLRPLILARQQSLDWAKKNSSDCFIIESSNLLMPHTLENIAKLDAQIAAPMLSSHNAWSNFHAAVTGNGYWKDSPDYFKILNREQNGLFKVPVVNGAVLVKLEALDNSFYRSVNNNRYEYVIFCENARINGIDQYLDNSKIYGILLLTNNKEEIKTNILETIIKLFLEQSDIDGLVGLDKEFIKTLKEAEELESNSDANYINKLSAIEENLNNAEILNSDIFYDIFYQDFASDLVTFGDFNILGDEE